MNRILRLFDGVRTFVQVIDDCGLPGPGRGRRDRQALSRADHSRHPRSRRRGRDGQRRHGRLAVGRGGAVPLARAPGAGPVRGRARSGRRRARAPDGADRSAWRGAREALDDDMRVRFTDRLQAEGAAEAADANVLADAASAAADAADTTAAAPALARSDEGIPQVPLEALIDSAPAGNGAGPTTLPEWAPPRNTRRARPARWRSPTSLPRLPSSACPTLCRCRRRRRCPASPPPPAGAAPASPLERPYGWTSEAGQPRSASGEIHVQKLPPSRQSQVDVPRVHVREDSSKAYVRKSTATPPGSARALDEPPPLAVRCPRRTGSRTRTSRPSHRPSSSRSRSSARRSRSMMAATRRSRRRTRRTSWASRRAGARCSRSRASAWWSRWARSPRSGKRTSRRTTTIARRNSR